ncbi:ras-like GTP-binding protein RYL1 [Pocillopora damicornis]|uniref:ras-like GTP-binding protein RYL1 n=1 Tax=Pocillopora damicornis TaxID=46731 RepID=UPI000F559903|nr:ras-like GTP-binding protein RYL1 [Pocillopora damicornis]
MPAKTTVKHKIALVGDSGVGKSKILSSYLGERFNPLYVQTRERETKNTVVNVGRRVVELQIWDTPGNDHFRTVTAAYVQEDVQGVVVVFDVTNYDSFLNVHHWVKTVEQYARQDNVNFVFVGNKTDMEEKRKVSKEHGEEVGKLTSMTVTHFLPVQIFQRMTEIILGIDEGSNTYNDRKSGAGDSGNYNGRVEQKGFCSFL